MESQERVVINCWSGPRCVSTSLMYSWAQRSDCQVRWGLQIGAEVQTAVLAMLQHVLLTTAAKPTLQACPASLPCRS